MSKKYVRLPPCVLKETRDELKKQAISCDMTFQEYLRVGLESFAREGTIVERLKEEVR
jgi:hypothetical protein